MKKTLAAVAILGAFAGSAMADVTVYGKVDLGIGYENLDGASQWSMKSGGSAASRVGLKGSEKISEDLTVGFNYEAGFTADDGRLNTAVKGTAADGVVTMDSKERFWSRVALLNVKGSFGELGFGYYGALESATGPYDVAGGLSAMGTGYFGVGGQDYVLNNRGGVRLENAITYKTPTFAGLTVSAQVGHTDAASIAKHEYSDESTMYYGVAAKYAAGDFGAGLVVSKVNEKQGGNEDLNVTAGVNYNFGVAKAYLAANYYDDGKDGDQYGVVASAEMPLMGGTLELQAGYGEKTVVTAGVEAETEKTFAGAFYKYPLSKQTYLYGAAGWDQDEAKDTTKDNYHAIFGMCHNF